MRNGGAERIMFWLDMYKQTNNKIEQTKQQQQHLIRISLWGYLSSGYSLGGDAYWATGLHLFAPLPYTRGDFFRRIRMHAFATAGNLVHYSEYTKCVPSQANSSRTDHNNIIFIIICFLCRGLQRFAGSL